MKTTMMRVLAIATLTTSMSAFALSGNSKTANETNTRNTNSDETIVLYVVEQPSSDQNEAQPNQKQKTSEEQQKTEQQDKQWLHDLQGVYGG
jgi:hypothetical protein